MLKCLLATQSTAGFIAMLKGVPAYFTDNTLKHIGNIKNIEKPFIDHNIFNNLSGQWTLKRLVW